MDRHRRRQGDFVLRKPSGKTALSAILFFLCLCLAAVPAVAASVSEVDVLYIELFKHNLLCLTWDLPRPDSGMYTVSVCQEGTQSCRFSGTTTARTYLLGSLEPDIPYSLHVGYANGGTVETKGTLPREKPAADGEGVTAAPLLPRAQTDPVTGNPSVQLLNASTVAVSWAENGKDNTVYSVSLRKTDDATEIPVGTTTESIFAIDGLSAGADYTVFIQASGSNRIMYNFHMPAAGDR